MRARTKDAIDRLSDLNLGATKHAHVCIYRIRPKCQHAKLKCVT
jgi:hypothetical protein